ncbi:MAG: Lrp/AsnC family transcriptional regulator [Thermoplasmata archaeon]|nr:MAG: Lrp/AsnC family transcriptional regulator [Thermoplasmata archaeon]
MDKRDCQIISILQENGRSTLSDIADKIGISPMGVKKRLDKLQKNRKIKIKALINAKRLKIITAIIAMELKDAETIEKIINKFRECPRIIKFFITTGSYNLFALIFAEDYHSLESVTLEKCSLRAQEGVRRFEIYPVQEIFYDSFMDINVIPLKNEKIAPCGVHCGECKRYESYKCLGCPATIYYRGKL